MKPVKVICNFIAGFFVAAGIITAYQLSGGFYEVNIGTRISYIGWILFDVLFGWLIWKIGREWE